jgi:hypothetical protein
MYELPEYVIDQCAGVFHVLGKRQAGKTTLAKRLVEWARRATVIEHLVMTAPTDLPPGPIVFENAFWKYDVLNEVASMAAKKTSPVVMTFCAPGLVGSGLAAMPKALFLLREGSKNLRTEAYDTWRPMFGGIAFEDLNEAWNWCEPTKRCLVIKDGEMLFLQAAKSLPVRK